jgi:hypothetical protein
LRLSKPGQREQTYRKVMHNRKELDLPAYPP